MHYAALEGRVADMEHLLIRGANPNAADAQGFTPLHFAAQQGALAAARLLLDGGANVDAANAHGNTPLWVAVFNSNGWQDMIELLVSYGADPTFTNNAGQSPIEFARRVGLQISLFSDLPSDS